MALEHWLAAGRLFRSINRASYRTSEATVQALRTANRRRSIRSGVLGPGSPTPHPGDLGDYYDYRGTAPHRELTGHHGVFRLGHHIEPGRRATRPIGLAKEDLFHHCLIVGPTGSGKTSNFTVPWIVSAVSQGMFVVTADVKGSGAPDYLPTALEAEFTLAGIDTSLISIWDYTNPKSLTWNPLQHRLAPSEVETLANSILNPTSASDRDRYFVERDIRWLRGLLSAANEAARLVDLAEVRAALASASDLRHFLSESRYSADLSDLVDLYDDDFSRAVSGLLNALHLFSHDDILAVTRSGAPISKLRSKRLPMHVDGRKSLSLPDAVTRPGVLVIGGPLADGIRAATLSTMAITQATNTLRSVGGPPAGSLMMIDEAGRLAERVNLPEFIATTRSMSIGFCLLMQDISDIPQEIDQKTLVANAATVALLKGCAASTTRIFSNRLGYRRIMEVTKHAEDAGSRRYRDSYGTSEQPVLGHREISSPPFARYAAVVHSTPLSPKPFIVGLT